MGKLAKEVRAREFFAVRPRRETIEVQRRVAEAKERMRGGECDSRRRCVRPVEPTVTNRTTIVLADERHEAKARPLRASCKSHLPFSARPQRIAPPRCPSSGRSRSRRAPGHSDAAKAQPEILATARVPRPAAVRRWHPRSPIRKQFTRTSFVWRDDWRQHCIDVRHRRESIWPEGAARVRRVAGVRSCARRDRDRGLRPKLGVPHCVWMAQGDPRTTQPDAT